MTSGIPRWKLEGNHNGRLGILLNSIVSVQLLQFFIYLLLVSERFPDFVWARAA
jgi:hypothetical protein